MRHPATTLTVMIYWSKIMKIGTKIMKIGTSHCVRCRVVLVFHGIPFQRKMVYVTYVWSACCVCLLAQHMISLSSLCTLISRHWTSNMLVRCMLSSVCLRLSEISQLSFIQYMGLCVFSLPNSVVMITRMHTLFYHHHQIRSMNH